MLAEREHDGILRSFTTGIATYRWPSGGRAFLQVHAIHRDTGEQYVLLYEDIANRKQPVQVIRFRPTSDATILRIPS